MISRECCALNDTRIAFSDNGRSFKVSEMLLDNDRKHSIQKHHFDRAKTRRQAKIPGNLERSSVCRQGLVESLLLK